MATGGVVRRARCSGSGFGVGSGSGGILSSNSTSIGVGHLRSRINIRSSHSHSAPPTSKEKGDALEMRVVRLLKVMGKPNVKRSVRLKDKHGNWSEIDVMYGWVFKTCIECKNYSGPVPLKDVAKFKEVLNLLGFSTTRGLFITTSTFVPRASTIGIKCIDGEALKKWERRAKQLRTVRRVSWVLLGGAVLWTCRDWIEGWARENHVLG